MAKPQKEYHVEVMLKSKVISIWCDKRHWNDLTIIEGIEQAFSMNNRLDLYIDPRYSIDEIANEIEELLSAQVPDVFKS